MKKVILPVVLVASSLVFFSFKPITKSVGVKEKEVKNAPATKNTCDKWNETHPTNFVSCYTVSTPSPAPAPGPEQPGTILAKY